jgi:hypothetical protein
MKRRDILKLSGAVWITPVVQAITLPAHAQTSPVIDPRGVGPEDPPCLPDEDCYVDPQCTDGDCEPDDPPTDVCPEEWSKSSFTWDGSSLCNHGAGPSLCPIRYEVIRFIAVNQGGSPYPSVQESGFIDPLGADGCHDFTALIQKYGFASQYDRICIRVYQDDGHPGVGYTQNCF